MDDTLKSIEILAVIDLIFLYNFLLLNRTILLILGSCQNNFRFEEERRMLGIFKR